MAEEMEVPRNRYVYAVFYHWADKNGLQSGHGMARCWQSEKATSWQWIEGVKTFLAGLYPGAIIIITNWKRLKGDETWEK